MVFAYLEPKEAAAFRWVGRVFAEIGLQYLAPKIHLKLREESYNQLFAIAKHPIASKYVVELNYETEGLGFITREEFDQMLTCTSVIPKRRGRAPSKRLASVFNERAWRAREREIRRNKRETAQLLNRAWSIYQEYQISYENVGQADFFREEMEEAFKRLPNLKMISTSTTSVYGRYVAEIKELLPTYNFGAGDKVSSNNGGATKSVLLAAVSAGLQIDIEDISPLRGSMLHLKIMNIAFAEPRHRPQYGRAAVTDISSEQCLEEGHLPSFLTSAPNLEYLRLKFKTWPTSWPFPRTNDINGGFPWSSLKAASPDRLATSDLDLVDFGERHAQTLRDLALRDMSMFSGSWNAISRRMLPGLWAWEQLDACKMSGLFIF